MWDYRIYITTLPRNHSIPNPKNAHALAASPHDETAQNEGTAQSGNAQTPGGTWHGSLLVLETLGQKMIYSI